MQERDRWRDIHLIVSARELADVLGSAVLEVEVLFDRQVAPVRDLEVADELGDGDEGLVVFKVERQFAGLEGLNVLVGTVDDRVAGTLLLDLGRRLSKGLDVSGGQLHVRRLRSRRIRAQEEHVVLVHDQLMLHLLDLGGVRPHGMSKDQSNGEIERGLRIERLGEGNRIKSVSGNDWRRLIEIT